MNYNMYTEWLGQIEVTKYKSPPIVLPPDILEWVLCLKIIWHHIKKYENNYYLVELHLTTWVIFPKKFAIFLCRDILVTEEITDDEVSDDTEEEMRRRYFTEQPVVDNNIFPLIQRQTISVL